MNPHPSLEQILEKDIDYKETVSFNYPKYEKMGTPHERWLIHTGLVEKSLENIIEKQPLAEEYPLVHIRREERDDSGRIIRVHFDLYGRTTLVKMALVLLNASIDMYVAFNMLDGTKGKELFESLPEDLKAAVKNAQGNLKAAFIPVSSSDPEVVKKEVSAYLKDNGIDPNNVKLVSASGTESSKELTKELQKTFLKPEGPLDLNALDEMETDEPDDYYPQFVFPNPTPDDYN